MFRNTSLLFKSPITLRQGSMCAPQLSELDAKLRVLLQPRLEQLQPRRQPLDELLLRPHLRDRRRQPCAGSGAAAALAGSIAAATGYIAAAIGGVAAAIGGAAAAAACCTRRLGGVLQPRDRFRTDALQTDLHAR